MPPERTAPSCWTDCAVGLRATIGRCARDRHEGRTASAILRAVFVHLYIAWIHPFGDGNGRTARLAEFMILAREGVPSPCAHLLSNHYNVTRAEYYRQLDRSSRANAGRGDPLGFLVYSLQGFVDGLREQSRLIAGIQLKLAWEHFVYGKFQRIRSSSAMRRRREVTLALGRVGTPVHKRAIPDLSPDLARLYAEKDQQDTDARHELAAAAGLPGEGTEWLPGKGGNRCAPSSPRGRRGPE